MSPCYQRFARTFRTLAVLTVTSVAAVPMAAAEPAIAQSLEARFRGCQSAGWCRFEIEGLASTERSLYRVYPDGVARNPDQDYSRAVRDRLNALLVDMIHQYKRVELRQLRSVGDGLFAAIIVVDGKDVAIDPILLELQAKAVGNSR